MIKRFVSIPSYLTFAIFLRLINFYFNIVSSYGVFFFCAAIRRDLQSLLMFSFLSHDQIFTCEISQVSRLKYPNNYFSSYFCFLLIVVPLIIILSVLFLVATDVSTLSSISLTWCLLVTYSLSISSLVCKALSIVISFLIVWSICGTYSCVFFKNDPGYITRKITQVYIPLMRFVLTSLVKDIFFLRWYYYYYYYSLRVFLVRVSWWSFTGV